MEDLRNTISLLEHEKREKAVDRIRYEKEIEQLEENWKKESQELLNMISHLQDDNKKLSSSLKEHEQQNISRSETPLLPDSVQASWMRLLHPLSFIGPVAEQPDWDLFEKLRESNEKQREHLRMKDKEYQDKLSEAETVNKKFYPLHVYVNK